MKSPRITPEEVGIIKRAQAGDESAFNALFYKYKEFVENLLFSYIKDMDEAKDMCNFVFLKVHEKLSMFTAYESFGGWLRILTNHVAVDYLRSMENKRHVLGDNDVRLASKEPGSSEENDLVNHMTYEQLMTEFNKFPEDVRKVFKLFYEKDMTIDEINKALKIPTGTIKSMLSRTRRKLKKRLKIN
jgi:RNA polymerase sigma-70 factor (ECF subfamily)